VRVTLSGEEAELLKGLITEYLELLDAGRDPADPVLARLFPSASLEHPDIDAEFRDLLGDDLDQHKRDTARRVLEYLEEEQRRPLTDEEQQAWLVLLTDLRLALGVRLGVTEESFEIMPSPNDPTQWPLAVLHYLGSLQESLVVALSA